jgi:monoamine oxidase
LIGAGAAGLAAARELDDAGYGVAVLEARDRVGGRAWTSYDLAPHAVELGAEFVHGENVVTWSYLERYGLHTSDQLTVLNLHGWLDGRLLGGAAFVGSTGMRLAFGTLEAARAAAPGQTLLDAARAWAAANGLKPTDEDWRVWTSFARQYWAGDPERLGAREFTERGLRPPAPSGEAARHPGRGRGGKRQDRPALRRARVARRPHAPPER